LPVRYDRFDEERVLSGIEHTVRVNAFNLSLALKDSPQNSFDKDVASKPYGRKQPSVTGLFLEKNRRR